MLITEQCADDKSKRARRVVKKSQETEVDGELVPLLSVEANRVVLDAAKEDRVYDTHWELRENLGKEVRCRRIHLVVDLAEEDSTLVREHENDILDGTHGLVHRDEE